MAFIELKLQLQREHADTLSDWLDDLGALAVTMVDAEDNPILEPGPGQTPLWEQLVLTALFDAEVDTDAIAAGLSAHVDWPAGTALRWQAVPDQDWIRVWMDRFQPKPFGRRLWVCPSWHPVPAEAEVPLLLDPGLAFGTGSHPTTQLCLEWLDGADLNNQHVLDYGCGSGILAIAAAKLGAAQLTAIDNDPQALLATRENAQRNNVALDSMNIALPPLNDNFHCDVIVANILAEPLRALAPSFANWLASGGHLVLSGLLAEQGQEMCARYSQWFDHLTITQESDWIRIHGIRR
jgi:ribosomal protein L11 methyltransferase